MIGTDYSWEKLGRIVAPDPNIDWMATWTGPACALQKGASSLYTVHMAGRDRKNRSQIGTIEIDLTALPKPLSISEQPCLSFGELGAFDENGVSYPWIVKSGDRLHLYYNGWMPSVLTPFQIHLGLAVSDKDGGFSRVSRAPILERTDEDHLSIGSAGVMLEDDLWKMWYTSFVRWGTASTDRKHYYNIKYAQSEDGIHWKRENKVCIDFSSADEFAICRPSVIKHAGKYHMWYSYRGDQYRIGYSVSDDGISWKRRDGLAKIDVSNAGWDSEAICYSFVFRHENDLFMLYCGNEYGKDGMGIARLPLSEV